VNLKVRRAELNDLDKLVEITAAEAREAEGHEKDTKTLRDGSHDVKPTTMRKKNFEGDGIGNLLVALLPLILDSSAPSP
jgi:hypothetical protein